MAANGALDSDGGLLRTRDSISQSIGVFQRLGGLGRGKLDHREQRAKKGVGSLKHT